MKNEKKKEKKRKKDDKSDRRSMRFRRDQKILEEGGGAGPSSYPRRDHE